MNNYLGVLTEQFVGIHREAGGAGKHVIKRHTQRHRINRGATQQIVETFAGGEHLANHVAIFCGSRNFILLFLSLSSLWIVLNVILLTRATELCTS